MRYQEIMELFTSKVDWSWTHNTNTGKMASFDIDGLKYNVDLFKSESGWEVTFDADGAYHLTGDGNALAVFSTLNDILVNFVNTTAPDVVFFCSVIGEQTRVSAYRRMGIQLARTIGYTYSERATKNEVIFTLSKHASGEDE